MKFAPIAGAALLAAAIPLPLAAQSSKAAGCVVPSAARPRPGRPVLAATLTVEGDLNLTCRFDDVDVAQGVSSCAAIPRMGGGNGKLLLPFPNFRGPQPRGSVHYEIRLTKLKGAGSYSKADLDSLAIDYASDTGRIVYDANAKSTATVTLNADGSGALQFTQLQRQADVFTRDTAGKLVSGKLSWECRNPK